MLHYTTVNLNNEYIRFLNNTEKTFASIKFIKKKRENIILIRINFN